MRNAATILLLLLTGYAQWGYDVQFIIRQWQMKEAAQEAWIAALPDKAFLRVSAGEIDAHGRWQEAGKECWYRDHLYDIIRQRQTGGTTWLFLLDDKNEERLIRQAGHPDNRSGHTLIITIGDQVCEPLPSRLAPPPVLPRCYPVANYQALPNQYNEILCPPPKAQPVF